MDETKITLLYANKEEKDIILRNELHVLAEAHPERLIVKHVIEKPEAKDWTGERGRIDDNMIRKYLPSANRKRSLVLVCGPEG